MARQVICYIEHREGKADDSMGELIQAARAIDGDADVCAVLFGSGAQLDQACQETAKVYEKVWKVDAEQLSYPNAELIRPMLQKLVPSGALVLLPFDSFGMDLGPGLSVKLDASYVADVIGFEGVSDGALVCVRQEYSGQAYAKMAADLGNGAVIAVRPGAFAADEGAADACGGIEDKSGEAGDVPAVKRRFVEVVEAEVGDVDITKSEVLVSIGRGIESEDNIELAEELADAMGAVVSCSRPIVDAKWLDKARQVGTSGQTVKPKIYMALGISGAFQHLGGIKGNPFMIAVNKNPKAPIFQVADVGVVADILELMPELTEKINEG